MRGLIAFALTRRPLIVMAVVLFAVGGLIAYQRLNIEAYPNPAPVILEITAQTPGLSAEEMERYYTIPMEVGLSSTPGVDNIRSTSFYGLSFVRVTFKYGVDYYFAYNQAAINLQQNVNLPGGLQPQIQASSLVGEIYRYQIVGPTHFGLSNLRTLQDWVLQRRLLTVQGVQQVVAWGGTTKEYEVEADPHKLEAYNVTLGQMIAAIGNANGNVGGRTVNIGQQSVNVRGVGLIDSVSDIENIVLAQNNGVPVLLRDVAHCFVGSVPRLGQAGRDADDDVVTGIVVMNRTLQTKEVLERVKHEIDQINSDGTLPAGVHVVPYYDRASLVDVTTHTVVHNLILGCVLVFLIQWVFLGDLRSAIIVSANIPFALFFSIIVLVLLGDSANLLSLGAVDFGIIVDSAVILVENVFRNFQTDREHRRELIDGLAGGEYRYISNSSMGWTNRLRIIFLSAIQVDRAVLFSSAITVAAFIPLFTMQGVEGQIFGPMARTYGYALSGALIATFTVTPVLASLLLPQRIAETETRVVAALRRWYSPVLDFALDRPRTVVAAGGALVALSLLLLPTIGSEFLPALEEGNLWIRATLPTTISLEAGNATVSRMRQLIKQHPEVITVVSQHGRPDDGSDASGFYNAEFFVPLRPFAQWPSGMTKDKLVNEMQDEFGREFVGVDLNFSQYIQDNIEEGLSGIKGANSVKIVGPDLATLERLGEEALHAMSQVKGVADLGIFRVLGQPNLNIQVDRARAARYGLNAGDVNSVVQTALGGTQATTVLEGDRQFALTVRLAPQFRSNVDDIRNLKVGYTTASGANAYVPLSDLATISLDSGASYIYHERNQRFIAVKFSVRGRDLGNTVADAQRAVSQSVKLPQGYHFQWAGEFGELQEAKHRLALILPVAVGMIIALLYTLFSSARDSMLTLAAIPLSIAGGIYALFFTGIDLSVSAIIGFVSLFGVSVMNGILIVTYFNQRIQSGEARRDAMHGAAEQCMRPVMMAAFSACIGLLPAAVSTGIGSQVQRPLATVVVGGLLLGPILQLIVAPALQILFGRGLAATSRPSGDGGHDDR